MYLHNCSYPKTLCCPFTDDMNVKLSLLHAFKSYPWKNTRQNWWPLGINMRPQSWSTFHTHSLYTILPILLQKCYQNYISYGHCRLKRTLRILGQYITSCFTVHWLAYLKAQFPRRYSMMRCTVLCFGEFKASQPGYGTITNDVLSQCPF